MPESLPRLFSKPKCQIIAASVIHTIMTKAQFRWMIRAVRDIKGAQCPMHAQNKTHKGSLYMGRVTSAVNLVFRYGIHHRRTVWR